MARWPLLEWMRPTPERGPSSSSSAAARRRHLRARTVSGLELGRPDEGGYPRDDVDQCRVHRGDRARESNQPVDTHTGKRSHRGRAALLSGGDLDVGAAVLAHLF